MAKPTGLSSTGEVVSLIIQLFVAEGDCDTFLPRAFSLAIAKNDTNRERATVIIAMLVSRALDDPAMLVPQKIALSREL